MLDKTNQPAISRTKKMKYLEGYVWAQSNIEMLEARIKEINLKLYGCRNPTISDMPRGGTGKDNSEMIDAKTELEQRIKKASRKKEAIRNTIDQVQSPKHNMILELKYIDDWSLNVIADMLGYSYKYTCTLHTQAVDAVSWRHIQ